MTTAVTFDQFAAIVAARGAGARRLTAIAGAPGAGKSLAAERLAARLNAGEPGSAAVLPMDGYHYDDLVLAPRGLRARKGAPETFDVAGLWRMLRRLTENTEAEIMVPVFDRDLEIARAAAAAIPRAVRHVIVEGNYLLLNREPWRTLRPLFDTTAMLIVPEAVLRRRLTARWQGYNLSPAEITAKVEGNDLPNGRLIAAESAAAEFSLLTGDQPASGTITTAPLDGMRGAPPYQAMSKPPETRRPTDPRKAAEAMFKPAPPKLPEPAARPAALPGVKEAVTLRLDQDVLEFFREDGPGWQDRINLALRKIIEDSRS